MASICWASIFKDCRGGMSGEHIASKGLFSQRTVSVSGFSWCKGMDVRIAVKSFVRNSLCRKHNSELAPVDTAGIKVFHALSADPASHRRGDVSVSGALFERWVLKTTLNHLVERNTHWLLEKSDDLGIPEALISYAFGRSAIQAPMGLYLESQVDESVPSSDDLSIEGHADEHDRLVGATVVIQGLRFLLWVNPYFAPLPQMFSPGKRKLIYHPVNIRMETPILGEWAIGFTWAGTGTAQKPL